MNTMRFAGYQHFILLAVLGVFALTFVERPDSVFGRLLWLIDVGLFLLWQPIVSAERKLTPVQVVVIFSLVFFLALKLNWGWLAAWGVFIASLVGGKVIVARQRRLGWFYLLAFAFLALIVFTWISPQLFDDGVRGQGEAPAVWVPWLSLGVLAATSLVLPWGPLREEAGVYDFLVSLLILLILSFVLMMTNGLMVIYRVTHMEALVRALLSLGGLVLLLSWAWNPRLGFSGMGTLASRYLLRLGFPFEDWLHKISLAFDREEAPDEFLRTAVESFADLPWVVGGVARLNGVEMASFGQHDKHAAELEYEGVQVTLYTAYHWTAALVWQANLLLKLVSDFYFAKLRERQLQQLRYLEAVHETGSRVTHDVKNLLQSLEGLCFAALGAEERDSKELAELVRRQLPVMTQRLRLTLDKLSMRQNLDASELPLADWWASVQAHYRAQNIGFACAGAIEERLVPASVFDNVLDNLLANALQKRSASPGLLISVSLELADSGCCLRVGDNGGRIPDAVVDGLFAAPVQSANGLGVGLFHAARVAARSGYRLGLANNRDGSVVFELAAVVGMALSGEGAGRSASR